MAQQHTLHKDLEIIHHRAEMSIDRQFELDKSMRLVDLQFRLGDRIINAVVNVKGGWIGIVDAIRDLYART